MTPTQLRAFVAVVRLGSVKDAAAELGVTESAVSLHIGQLRKELGDKLFLRTANGIAFTPGGLRLASRAAEMLGLQDRTVHEVSHAASGRRLLRVAAESLFAEHAASGLIELFAGRASDLDVELSVDDASDFESLLLTRSVDVAIGERLPADPAVTGQPFLNYQLIGVVSAGHPLARIHPGAAELREQTWLLGPSAASREGLVQKLLRRLAIPESNERIFQSHVAALEEAKRGKGIALTVSFAAAQDLASGGLRRIAAATVHAEGTWTLLTLAGRMASPAAAELSRFVTTPRATQAMLRGSGVTVGRFKPSIHVTLWS